MSKKHKKEKDNQSYKNNHSNINDDKIANMKGKLNSSLNNNIAKEKDSEANIKLKAIHESQKNRKEIINNKPEVDNSMMELLMKFKTDK